MRIAVCPGSFDPITHGHLDIIKRGARIFDKVIVLVVINFAKKNVLFTPEERIALIERAVEGLDNVVVDTYDGLLVDYARDVNAVAIIKGLRAVTDFEYEFQQALTNKRLNADVETVFMTTRAENMFLSSSIVKQICTLGGDISEFVPACILDDIVKKIIGKDDQP